MNAKSLMAILRLVDLLAAGLQLAPEVKARFDASSEKVKQMVAEGRDPTPEEWDALNAETEELMSQIAAS